MKPVAELISPACIDQMAEAIASAGGNEVFFLCSSEEGLVTTVRPLARGNEAAVPAIIALARFGDIVIHNHPSGYLAPSDADISVASDLASRGTGFYIVNNQVTDIYVVVEGFGEHETTPVNETDIDMTLGPGGTISGKLHGYEIRKSQIRMACQVSDAFNSDRLLLVEAGTGVGKSMAYLVPAVLWAVRNRERVVISTNTINLQEQLIKKDIPFLQTALDTDFKAVLVKGRRNYACLRKAAEMEIEPELFPDESASERKAVIEWLKKTKDGSISDLSFTPRHELWDEFASEADTCMKLRCRFFSECFFNRARREVAAADLVVANHHLLFSDLAIRAAKVDFAGTAVLPPYSRVVIDEAHNVEDAATEYFGDRVSRGGVLKQLGRLRHRKDRRKGLLPFIAARLSKLESPTEEMISYINGELFMILEVCGQSLLAMFDTLYFFFSSIGDSPEPELRIRIDEAVKNSPKWDETAEEVRESVLRINSLVKGLNALNRSLAQGVRGNEETERELLPMMTEVKALSERFEAMAASIENILFSSGNEAVRWVELGDSKSGGTGPITLHLSPLNVGVMLNDVLYKNFRTVVMTSATLSVKGRFEFMERRTGLDLVPKEKLTESLLPSPFNFMEQVLLGMVTDLPEPTLPEFPAALSTAIHDAVSASHGGTLILFTSYSMMNRVFNNCSGGIRELRCEVMKQGEAPRHELIERFRRDRDSVLFGTESFWEGVDVPGDSLRQVIITRLPFTVPDDPVLEARQEEIERNGGSAFRDYLLPMAVIKFRQGFGRLIRRKSDRGIVLIMDTRAATKNYGKAFLSSLPPCKVVRGNSMSVIKEISTFIGRRP